MKLCQITGLCAVLALLVIPGSLGCDTSGWYNMTMEQLLFKSDIVVYGKDIEHGKFRLPTFIDARFDIYCVFKAGEYNVPGQVIIEDIFGGDDCSGVKGQTEVGKEYIIGLTREHSGFMTYSNSNPHQKTAFPVTLDNLKRLAAACGLDQWSPPETGIQSRCPVPVKPRMCTEVQYGDEEEELNAGVFVEASYRLTGLALLLLFWAW